MGKKKKAYQKAPKFSMMCVLFHCDESINPTWFYYRYVGEKGLTEMEVPARFSYALAAVAQDFGLCNRAQV